MVHALIRILFAFLLVFSAGAFAQNGGEQPVDPAKGNAQATKPEITPEEALQKYTINLSQQQREGKLRPYIGEQEQIRKILEVMGKDGNKVLYLLGEPGTGKTSIVEELTKYLPQGVELYSLNLNGLEAGTRLRGDQEARLEAIIKAFENNPNRVLFIDEAHVLMRNEDLRDKLKPVMEGHLRSILATTKNEYRIHIEPDPAATSRGNVAELANPTEVSILRVLRAKREGLNKTHGIYVTDGALKAAARMVLRYYPYEPAFRKAYDIVDRTMSRAVLNMKFGEFDSLKLLDLQTDLLTEQKILEADLLKVEDKDGVIKDRLAQVAEELISVESQLEALKKGTQEDIQRRINDANRRVQELTMDGKFQEAAEVRFGELPKLEAEKLNAVVSAVSNEIITEQNIAKFVSSETGISLGNLAAGEMEKARTLKAILSARVPGQEHAAERIAIENMIQVADVEESKGPRQIILLAGSSGNGKTELTKATAFAILGDADRVVRLAMGSLGHGSSMQFTGSGPGLVNSDGASMLEPVRKQGYVVLNLDEYNLADRSIDNLLMEGLDTGEMKDAMGRKINLRNTIIFITTNWAEDYALNKDKWTLREVEVRYEFPIGSLEGLTRDEIDQRVLDKAMIRAGCSQAFRNRIRHRILMNVLTMDNAVQIAQIKLTDQKAYMLKRHGVTVEWGEGVAKFLAEQSYEPAYGMREVNTKQHDVVSRLLAEVFFKEGSFKRGDKITVKVTAPSADGKTQVLEAYRGDAKITEVSVTLRSQAALDIAADKRALDVLGADAATERVVEGAAEAKEKEGKGVDPKIAVEGAARK